MCSITGLRKSTRIAHSSTEWRSKTAYKALINALPELKEITFLAMDAEYPIVRNDQKIILVRKESIDNWKETFAIDSQSLITMIEKPTGSTTPGTKLTHLEKTLFRLSMTIPALLGMIICWQKEGDKFVSIKQGHIKLAFNTTEDIYYSAVINHNRKTLKSPLTKIDYRIILMALTALGAGYLIRFSILLFYNYIQTNRKADKEIYDNLPRTSNESIGNIVPFHPSFNRETRNNTDAST